jgi:flagellar biosynthesis/type III secretory pathway chaperone
MNGDDAVNDVIDTLLSLVRVMEEESERLALAGPGAPVTELAQAKARLAGRLDQLGARLEREDADWMRRVEGDQRESGHLALSTKLRSSTATYWSGRSRFRAICSARSARRRSG